MAKEQRKTADQRRDFHHKLARAIADNYTAFICEDLAVKNMMKNRHLSKAIASVGWSQFLTIVKYKMETCREILPQGQPVVPFLPDMQVLRV